MDSLHGHTHTPTHSHRHRLCMHTLFFCHVEWQVQGSSSALYLIFFQFTLASVSHTQSHAHTHTRACACTQTLLLWQTHAYDHCCYKAMEARGTFVHASFLVEVAESKKKSFRQHYFCIHGQNRADYSLKLQYLVKPKWDMECVQMELWFWQVSVVCMHVWKSPKNSCTPPQSSPDLQEELLQLSHNFSCTVEVNQVYQTAGLLPSYYLEEGSSRPSLNPSNHIHTRDHCTTAGFQLCGPLHNFHDH